MGLGLGVKFYAAAAGLTGGLWKMGLCRNGFSHARDKTIRRMRMSSQQEIETLINEEALLFAQYLGEMKDKHGLPELPTVLKHRIIYSKRVDIFGEGSI